MKGSLRIMHFGFLISVIVAVLIIGKSLDATAQGREVVCPCDFESVPMTTGCWVEPYGDDPDYIDLELEDPNTTICRTGQIRDEGDIIETDLGVEDNTQDPDKPSFCFIELQMLTDCNAEGGKTIITPEQVKACQCELLAYTTALNEVDGISVSPEPPYECFDVDCQQKVLTPIPTLNEYGMIITAGVLGLLAVIGLLSEEGK